MTEEQKIKEKIKLLNNSLVVEVLYDFNHHSNQIRDLLKHYQNLLSHSVKPNKLKNWVQRDLEDQIREETQNY